jgi:glutamyl/glutaminyl-tRNA synthetase
MTEELALDEVLGNRRAVELLKWPVGSWGAVVDGSSDELLSSSAFPLNHDRCTSPARKLDLFSQRDHRAAFAKKRIEAATPVLELAILDLQFPVSQTSLEGQEEAFRGYGFLEEIVRTYAEAAGAKLGKVAQPLRVALTGKTVSPPVFDVMAVLGREEAVARIRDQAA